MKITCQPKEGVTFEEALDNLSEWIEKCEREENDVHTNKHFTLIKGEMWKKGDGTGKMWDYLNNSREAQRDAHSMLGFD